MAYVPLLSFYQSKNKRFGIVGSDPAKTKNRYQKPFETSGLIVAGFFLFFFFCSAHQSVGQLVAFDMNNTTTLPGGSGNYGPSPYAPTSTSANITATGLTRGSGVGTSGSGAARGWGGNNWSQTDAAAGITTSTFITFSVQANSGYLMSLSSISPFNYRRSSTGPSSGLIEYSINSGAFTAITTVSFSSTSASGASLPSTDLSTIAALQNLPSTSVVTFRLTPFGATNAAGTFYIFDVGNSTANDLAINGTVISAPLPVTYYALNARYTASKSVDITWSTSMELNNAYFEIERSADVQSFKSIGRVGGKGTSYTQQHYLFTDETPMAGWNYYRLKQVDADGKESYSKALPVLNKVALAESELSLWPNPVERELTVQLNTNATAKTIAVYTLQGSLVNRLTGESANQLNVSALPAGNYVLEVITTDNRALRQRFVKP